MDKQSATKLIRETFENPFDKVKFVRFVRDLFNKIVEDTFEYQGQYIPDAFKPYIQRLERVGKYMDIEGKKIDILITHLKKETSLERARTMQRNFIAWYLEGSRGGTLKDAAVVAFVSPELEDWRFSLVKMEYKLTKTKTGRPKGEEEFTPAKRFSFLVGRNEPNHTAQSQLYRLLKDDINNPTLTQLEDAFNIEIVTKEFFEKYRDLFICIKEAIDEIVNKYPSVTEDFTNKGVDTVDFAKKLMGQIVFLYFLQKKGWFGVEKGKDWGTGSKRFLRDLYEGKIIQYKNFFNDLLEPLFYDALARDRSDIDHYNEHFKTKIPFLNGGLFDPINNYDWVNTDILLSDELFSNNKKTKQGDIGDGILDIFDRYNFTVKEDEPLEKEVAIDPELLGKAYEKFNAIRSDNFEEYKKALRSGQKRAESKFNKQYGVYYTPREIVHYMCQQSLISYLVIGMEGRISKEAIEFLILNGEKYVEYLKTAKEKKDEGKKSERYRETDYFIELKKHATDIDNFLSNIKVCDPAIGSGAFPVGMMTEIIKARLFFLETKCLSDSYKNLQGDEVKRNPYNYKRDCIQNSLYGVDIDPGAVEIAKLRLWLSLVVDEEDIKAIKPLPNLDYKIMQGNSLIEEYEGIKLIDEKFFQKTEDKIHTIKYLEDEQKKLEKEYIDLHKQKQIDCLTKAQLEQKLRRVTGEIKKMKISPKSDEKNLDLFVLSETKQKADKLLDLQKQFFDASHKSDKNKLKDDIERLIWDLIETTLKEQGKKDKIKEIAQFQRTNTKPFFLWHLHFANVFQEKDGFDVVIANPPYIRSHIMVKELSIVRDYITSHYKTAKGNWDIYIPFWELGLRLLNSLGTVSLITPNKWFSVRYASHLREYLSKNIYLIANYSKLRVFEEVGVFAIVCFCSLVPKQSFSFYEFDDAFRPVYSYKNLKNAILSNLDNWGMIFSRNFSLVNKINSSPHKIADLYSVQEAFVVSEAYELSKYVKEFRGKNAKYKKLITTGAIDKYISLWGFEEMRYLKKRYKMPIVFEKDIKEISLLRYDLACSKKIIVSGIRHFESLLDKKGEYLPAISTVVIREKNKELPLEFLLPILNSRFMTFYLRECYGSLAMDGGINFTAPLISQIPLPGLHSHIKVELIDLAEKILKVTGEKEFLDNVKSQARVKEYERQIDQMVYKLYSLTDDEIKIVEK